MSNFSSTNESSNKNENNGYKEVYESDDYNCCLYIEIIIGSMN
jgi:hypothetical protein